jgi:hypothetical protein
MGTTAQNHSDKLGLRVRAALVGASAVYVGALALFAGMPHLPAGLSAATPAAPAQAAVTETRATAHPERIWIETADFLPALQINGIGITQRRDF